MPNNFQSFEKLVEKIQITITAHSDSPENALIEISRELDECYNNNNNLLQSGWFLMAEKHPDILLSLLCYGLDANQDFSHRLAKFSADNMTTGWMVLTRQLALHKQTEPFERYFEKIISSKSTRQNFLNDYCWKYLITDKTCFNIAGLFDRFFPRTLYKEFSAVFTEAIKKRNEIFPTDNEETGIILFARFFYDLRNQYEFCLVSNKISDKIKHAMIDYILSLPQEEKSLAVKEACTIKSNLHQLLHGTDRYLELIEEYYPNKTNVDIMQRLLSNKANLLGSHGKDDFFSSISSRQFSVDEKTCFKNTLRFLWQSIATSQPANLFKIAALTESENEITAIFKKQKDREKCYFDKAIDADVNAFCVYLKTKNIENEGVKISLSDLLFNHVIIRGRPNHSEARWRALLSVNDMKKPSSKDSLNEDLLKILYKLFPDQIYEKCVQYIFSETLHAASQNLLDVNLLHFIKRYEILKELFSRFLFELSGKEDVAVSKKRVAMRIGAKKEFSEKIVDYVYGLPENDERGEKVIKFLVNFFDEYVCIPEIFIKKLTINTVIASIRAVMTSSGQMSRFKPLEHHLKNFVFSESDKSLISEELKKIASETNQLTVRLYIAKYLPSLMNALGLDKNKYLTETLKNDNSEIKIFHDLIRAGSMDRSKGENKFYNILIEYIEILKNNNPSFLEPYLFSSEKLLPFWKNVFDYAIPSANKQDKNFLLRLFKFNPQVFIEQINFYYTHPSLFNKNNFLIVVDLSLQNENFKKLFICRFLKELMKDSMHEKYLLFSQSQYISSAVAEYISTLEGDEAREVHANLGKTGFFKQTNLSRCLQETASLNSVRQIISKKILSCSLSVKAEKQVIKKQSVETAQHTGSPKETVKCDTKSMESVVSNKPTSMVSQPAGKSVEKIWQAVVTKTKTDNHHLKPASSAAVRVALASIVDSPDIEMAKKIEQVCAILSNYKGKFPDSTINYIAANFLPQISTPGDAKQFHTKLVSVSFTSETKKLANLINFANTRFTLLNDMAEYDGSTSSISIGMQNCWLALLPEIRKTIASCLKGNSQIKSKIEDFLIQLEGWSKKNIDEKSQYHKPLDYFHYITVSALQLKNYLIKSSACDTRSYHLLNGLSRLSSTHHSIKDIYKILYETLTGLKADKLVVTKPNAEASAQSATQTLEQYGHFKTVNSIRGFEDEFEKEWSELLGESEKESSFCKNNNNSNESDDRRYKEALAAFEAVEIPQYDPNKPEERAKDLEQVLTETAAGSLAIPS